MSDSRSPLREYIEAILIAGVFLVFANTFVVKTFYIPSASMESTLLIGDHLFVNRFIFRPVASEAERMLLPQREVERGDVVIFRSPERPRVDMVKRCVALPGDTVEIVDKALYINGERVDDSAYTERRDPRILGGRRNPSQLRNRDNFGPYEVPAEHYFCMGDNRDHSWDSRFWGPVPAHYVKGRALLVYWSYGGEVSDGEWHGWGSKLRQLGGTALGFFTRSRWNRTLHLIR